MKFQPGNKCSPGRPKGSKNKFSFKTLKDQLATSSFSMVSEIEKLLADPKATPEFRFDVIKWLVDHTEPKTTPEDDEELNDEDLEKIASE